MNCDTVWDCDAPKFVDFSNLEMNDDDADKWFEMVHESPETLKMFMKREKGTCKKNLDCVPTDTDDEAGNQQEEKWMNATSKPVIAQQHDENLKKLKDSVHDIRKPFKALQIDSDGSVVNPSRVKGMLAKKSPFRSMAERVIAFHKQTPERFHTRVKKEASNNLMEKPRPHITIPITPKLKARFRTRNLNVMSTEERERLEYEACLKNKFKAQPLNPTVLQQNTGNLPRVLKKPSTIVEPFKLTQVKESKEREQSPLFEFHAKPIPEKILERPLGVPELKRTLPTVPYTPLFMKTARRRSRSVCLTKADFTAASTLKKSAQKQVLMDSMSTPGSLTSSSSSNMTGISVKSKTLERKITQVMPFSFDVKDKLRYREKEKKIKMFLEEERKKREFHSRPLPNFDEPRGLPEKKVLPATTVCPFNLTKKQHHRQQTESPEIEKYHFKAQEPTVLYKDAFLPARSRKPTTRMLNVELNTKLRAMSREDYEEAKAAREAAAIAKQRQIELWMEMRKEEELKQLRKTLVHKANSIRTFKSVNVHPSEKPLTVPESPRFINKDRRE